jgi:hypothetical protein
MATSKYIEDLKNAILKRESFGESQAPFNHLAQMKLMGKRQGVEFYPEQDDELGSRTTFVRKFIKDNKIRLSLDRLWDYLIATGSVCFLLVATKKGYRLRYYHKAQFRAQYDENDDLTTLTIIYSYNRPKQVAAFFEPLVQRSENPTQEVSWIRLVYTDQWIVRSETPIEPTFDQVIPSATITPNYMGFIPAAIADNYYFGSGTGGQGTDDFSPARIGLLTTELLQRALNKNLKKFSRPTIVTSKSLAGFDSAAGGDTSDSYAARQGYVGRDAIRIDSGGVISSNSTAPSDLEAELLNIDAVPEFIDDVDAGDRLDYLQVQPTTATHISQLGVQKYEVRASMGGADDSSLSLQTATETRAVMGRVGLTARDKAEALYTYGLCEIIEMAIAADELLWRRSAVERYAINSGIDFAPIMEKLQAENPAIPQEEIYKYALIQFETYLPNSFVEALYEDPAIIPYLVGLPPLGDRTIKWRFLGEVFPDTPFDQQTKSIVGRNLSELGISTIHILRYIYPDKTDRELELLTQGDGYPFRAITQAVNSFNQLLGIHQQAETIPTYSNPDIPEERLSDRLGTLELLESSVIYLRGQLENGNTTGPIGTDLLPGDASPSSDKSDLLATQSGDYATRGDNSLLSSATGVSASDAISGTDSGFSNGTQRTELTKSATPASGSTIAPTRKAARTGFWQRLANTKLF